MIWLGLYTLLFCLTTPDIVGNHINDTLESWSVPFFGILSLVSGFFITTRSLTLQKRVQK